MEISKFTNVYDAAYAEASILTGKSESELRAMGEKVFATMLFHAALNRGRLVWTVTAIIDGRLDVEVNMEPRHRSAPNR